MMSLVHVQINLNCYVFVRLNELGKKIWEEYWNEAVGNSLSESVLIQKTLPDGRIRFQLWELMHAFGPKCILGLDSPFTDNQIEFEGEGRNLDRPSHLVLADLKPPLLD
jgi:hypothetical protein